MATVGNTSNDFLSQIRQKQTSSVKKTDSNPQPVAAAPVNETKSDAFVSKTKKDNKALKTAGFVALALATVAGVAYGLNIKGFKDIVNKNFKKLFNKGAEVVQDKVTTAKRPKVAPTKGVGPDGFGHSKAEALVRGPKPPNPPKAVSQAVKPTVAPQVQQAAAPVKPQVQQAVKPKQPTVLDAAKEQLSKTASVDEKATVDQAKLLQEHFQLNGKVQTR